MTLEKKLEKYRENLAKYEALGLTERADIQRRLIERLEK